MLPSDVEQEVASMPPHKKVRRDASSSRPRAPTASSAQPTRTSRFPPKSEAKEASDKLSTSGPQRPTTSGKTPKLAPIFSTTPRDSRAAARESRGSEVLDPSHSEDNEESHSKPSIPRKRCTRELRNIQRDLENFPLTTESARTSSGSQNEDSGTDLPGSGRKKRNCKKPERFLNPVTDDPSESEEDSKVYKFTMIANQIEYIGLGTSVGEQGQAATNKAGLGEAQVPEQLYSMLIGYSKLIPEVAISCVIQNSESEIRYCINPEVISDALKARYTRGVDTGLLGFNDIKLVPGVRADTLKEVEAIVRKAFVRCPPQGFRERGQAVGKVSALAQSVTQEEAEEYFRAERAKFSNDKSMSGVLQFNLVNALNRHEKALEDRKTYFTLMGVSKTAIDVATTEALNACKDEVHTLMVNRPPQYPTVQELQEENNRARTDYVKAEHTIQTLEARLRENGARLQQAEAQVERGLDYMNVNHTRLRESEIQNRELQDQLQARDNQLQARDDQLQARDNQLQARDDQLQARDNQLQARDDQINYLKRVIDRVKHGKQTALEFGHATYNLVDGRGIYAHQGDEIFTIEGTKFSMLSVLSEIPKFDMQGDVSDSTITLRNMVFVKVKSEGNKVTWLESQAAERTVVINNRSYVSMALLKEVTEE